MRMYVVVLLVLLGCSAAAAQDEKPEVVTIRKDQLTKQQLQEVAVENAAQQLKTYGFAAGIGHEVGVALNEGLSAVTVQANNFAQTPVGKWTVAIIVFKVLGQQAVGFLVGMGMYLIGLPTWIWSYRKYAPAQRLVKEVMDKETGTKVVERQYQWYGGDSDWRIGHAVFLAAMIAASMVCFFGPW